MVKVSWESISEAALQGVLDDYVLREGTDYGAQETSLQHKRAQVLGQLQRGQAHIWFDATTQTVTIRLAEQDD